MRTIRLFSESFLRLLHLSCRGCSTEAILFLSARWKTTPSDINYQLQLRRSWTCEASIPHALAIYGLGGTSKTQLALRYIEDHKDDTVLILWIDTKDEESVQSSFERCASELQLQGAINQAQSTTSLVNSASVQAVLRWLQNRTDADDRWLVVVDNASDFTGRSKQ